jgi:hypothetical protein
MNRLRRSGVNNGQGHVRESHAMSIGNEGRVPGEINPDEPTFLPLREVIAAASVVARIRDLLGGPDRDVADAIALKLTNVGAPGGDWYLPARGKIPEAPTVVDADTARDYLDALYKHLVEGKPWGGLDPKRPVL